MWLKRIRPHATVIMVEPDLGNLAAGKANFARNGFEGEFIHAAVGKGLWELDDFFATRGLSHLDILHVDIQGAEGALLDGGRQTLGNSRIDYLCVSTHSQALHRGVAERAQLDSATASKCRAISKMKPPHTTDSFRRKLYHATRLQQFQSFWPQNNC